MVHRYGDASPAGSGRPDSSCGSARRPSVRWLEPAAGHAERFEDELADDVRELLAGHLGHDAPQVGEPLAEQPADRLAGDGIDAVQVEAAVGGQAYDGQRGDVLGDGGDRERTVRGNRPLAAQNAVLRRLGELAVPDQREAQSGDVVRGHLGAYLAGP